MTQWFKFWKEWGYEKVDHPPEHWLSGQIGIAEQKKGWVGERDCIP